MTKQNLKYLLRDELSKKELSFVPSSFDVVGDILVFSEFPKELAKKEKLIGESILQNYRHIKTVLKKTRKYSGKYRTAKLKVIAGEKRKETVHKENNVILKLDVEKVYFSARMSNERKRVASLVKPKESVLVMFSGCAVYSLVIAKNSACKEVYGIEINPMAHRYALENTEKNKLEHKVKSYLGDVEKVMPKINKKFDRILMPLPKGGERFLGLAIKHAKKNGFIHFYDFLDEKEFHRGAEKVKLACSKAKRKCFILQTVKCGQYSPRFYRICVGFKVR